MSSGMIGKGQEKVDARGLGDKIDLQVGDGQDLPYDDESFDAITISFGIRNIPDVKKCLRECLRAF